MSPKLKIIGYYGTELLLARQRAKRYRQVLKQTKARAIVNHARWRLVAEKEHIQELKNFIEAQR